jgi:hypothetical protein
MTIYRADSRDARYIDVYDGEERLTQLLYVDTEKRIIRRHMDGLPCDDDGYLIIEERHVPDMRIVDRRVKS